MLLKGEEGEEIVERKRGKNEVTTTSHHEKTRNTYAHARGNYKV